MSNKPLRYNHCILKYSKFAINMHFCMLELKGLLLNNTLKTLFEVTTNVWHVMSIETLNTKLTLAPTTGSINTNLMSIKLNYYVYMCLTSM